MKDIHFWKCATRKDRAFTLTDLLALVGTMALLAGVLVPAYAGANRKSGILECKNNLRQVGTAIDSYTKDHQDNLPGPLWNAMFFTYAGANSPANSGLPTTYSLAYHLAPYFGLPAAGSYLREVPALKCPVSFEARPTRPYNPDPLFQWLAYVSCPYVTNTPGALIPAYPNSTAAIILAPFGRPNSPTIAATKLGNIKRPSEQWAITDADQTNAMVNSTYYAYLPSASVHNTRPGGSRDFAVRNYLYFDGSVRPVQTTK